MKVNINYLFIILILFLSKISGKLGMGCAYILISFIDLAYFSLSGCI